MPDHVHANNYLGLSVNERNHTNKQGTMPKCAGRFGSDLGGTLLSGGGRTY